MEDISTQRAEPAGTTVTANDLPGQIAVAPGAVDRPPPPPVPYHQADVTAGGLPAVVGGSFTFSGTASCDLLKDIPNDENGVFVRHADEDLTSVMIGIGGAPPVAATPTGLARTP